MLLFAKTVANSYFQKNFMYCVERQISKFSEFADDFGLLKNVVGER